MLDICPICEEEHEIELLDSGMDEDVAWEDWLCVKTGRTFTRICPPKKEQS